MLYLRFMLLAFIAFLFLAAIGQFVTNVLDKVNPFLMF